VLRDVRGKASEEDARSAEGQVIALAQYLDCDDLWADEQRTQEDLFEREAERHDLLAFIAEGTNTIFDPAWRPPPCGQGGPPCITPCSGSIVVVDYDTLAWKTRDEGFLVFVVYAEPRPVTTGWTCAAEWIPAHRVRSPWPARTP